MRQLLISIAIFSLTAWNPALSQTDASASAATAHFGKPSWMMQSKPGIDPDQIALSSEVRLAREHKFHRNFVNPIDAQGAANIGSRSYVMHARTAPIPVSSSDTIVIATPRDFQPYFAEGHSSVYTDLSLSVDKSIFEKASIQSSDRISILYSGGKISNSRNESAYTELAAGSTPLEIGHKYVLFLNYDPATESFEIQRAWDLTSPKPILLDQNGEVSPINVKLNIPSQAALEAEIASQLQAAGH